MVFRAADTDIHGRLQLLVDESRAAAASFFLQHGDLQAGGVVAADGVFADVVANEEIDMRTGAPVRKPAPGRIDKHQPHDAGGCRLDRLDAHCAGEVLLGRRADREGRAGFKP